MGRNNTRAAKSIAKMYEQLGLPQDDIFHKTKLLLSMSCLLSYEYQRKAL